MAKSLTAFKLYATTPNNMQQHVQTDATCNIHQFWELLANNFASVCTGLKRENKTLIYNMKPKLRNKAVYIKKPKYLTYRAII